ncbi:MAG: flagellar basal body P-ring protein FlgI [Immundisolibacteraceae bacterium]|nr:flagellar basal body P-ring protein FlgI [Immundisolibacteraceae bacterium]
MGHRKFSIVRGLIGLCALAATGAVSAERIKDLVSINGIRSNQLIGYGLVVGLDGSGDSEVFTQQSLNNMLQRLGVTLPAGVKPKSKNIAAVVIHADLPPFASIGQQIDITISTLGSAKSLRGGSLLMTPLKGIDNNVYAIAQGNAVVGGFSVNGRDGSSVVNGIPTVARIPGGAVVERTVPSPFADGQQITLSLHQADFTTAERLSKTINETFGMGTAWAQDGGTVGVSAPVNPAHRVSFVSLLENLEMEAAEAAARIVVNSRTGTVVIGRQVRVTTAAISHGGLSVTITESTDVSQPGPLSDGETAAIARSDIQVRAGSGRMLLFEPGIDLADLVGAINRIGAAPDDLIAILQALRESGALRAELVVI